MKNGTGMLLGTIAVIFLVFAGAASCEKTQALPQRGGEPADLVMNACTACHDTKRICDRLGKTDRDAWTRIVTEMVGKGASVAQEDIPRVAGYLADLQPGSPPVCK